MLKSLCVIVAVIAMTAISAEAMRLTSPTLHNGQTIPMVHVYNGFGYHGQNLSPELFWTGAPITTKSFALTVFDPDAPRDGGWWHWLVINIPAGQSFLPQGATAGHGLPAGAMQIRNDFDIFDYGGPAPPAGPAHHYVFTLYALKVARLEVDPSARPEQVKALLEGQSLARASLTGLFGR